MATVALEPFGRRVACRAMAHVHRRRFLFGDTYVFLRSNLDMGIVWKCSSGLVSRSSHRSLVQKPHRWLTIPWFGWKQAHSSSNPYWTQCICCECCACMWSSSTAWTASLTFTKIFALHIVQAYPVGRKFFRTDSFVGTVETFISKKSY